MTTQRDRDRLVVLKKAQKRLITQAMAAADLQLSKLQVRRLPVNPIRTTSSRQAVGRIHALSPISDLSPSDRPYSNICQFEGAEHVSNGKLPAASTVGRDRVVIGPVPHTAVHYRCGTLAGARRQMRCDPRVER